MQCKSLVGQVAHPIFFVCCGRASLLVGAFVQVGQCAVGLLVTMRLGFTVGCAFWPG